MDKKYELLDETIEHNGRTLYRIKALKDFDDVKRGDLGGYVQSENNLSHEDNCWLYDKSKVYDLAKVSKFTKMYDHSEMFDKAMSGGQTKISGYAKVHESAVIFGGYSDIGENAIIRGEVEVSGAIIKGNAELYGELDIRKGITILDNAKVYGTGKLYNGITIKGNAKVHGDLYLHGNLIIDGDVEITKFDDYMLFQNTESNNQFITWTKPNNMWTDGKFYGSAKGLLELAYAESQASGNLCKAYVELVETLHTL